MRYPSYRYIIISLCLIFTGIDAIAASKKGFTFYLENDSRDIGGPGSDNAYSSGLRISYVSAMNKTPKWADAMMAWPELLDQKIKNDEKNFGLSLGQQLYTPNDIREPRLIINDRPYAAWLYVGFTSHFKSEKRSHSFELDLGVVGPEAQGEYVQNGYHKIIRKYPAEGWSNQLGTEPTLQMTYQQRQQFFELSSPSKNKYFDVIPFHGLSLGTVAIDAHVGGLLRAGFNLPNDFGPVKAASTEGDVFVSDKKVNQLSIYSFLGARATGVVRNIFLDGNSFKQSHHVHKIPLVIESEFGFAAEWYDWNLAWRFVTRSPEFTERSDYNSFASIAITHLF